MAKKKTYAAVMEDMSKKLHTYQTRLQEAQQRGDTVGMQDYGRRIQRVQAGMETLFNTQEASKQPQPTMQMGYGGIPQYGDGTPETPANQWDDKQYELGLRTYNVGALISWGNRPQITTPDGRKFARFDTLEDGWNALNKQLKTYQGTRKDGRRSGTGITGKSTLREAMSKYAPKFENDTKGYITRLVDYLNAGGENITPDTPISEIPTDKWASAIALVESPQGYAALERANLLNPEIQAGLANESAVVKNRNTAAAFQQAYPAGFTSGTQTEPQPEPARSGPRTTSSPEPEVAPRAQQPNQAQLDLQRQAEQDARDVTSTAPIPGQSALERQIAATAQAIRQNTVPGVFNPFEEDPSDVRPGASVYSPEAELYGPSEAFGPYSPHGYTADGRPLAREERGFDGMTEDQIAVMMETQAAPSLGPRTIGSPALQQPQINTEETVTTAPGVTAPKAMTTSTTIDSGVEMDINNRGLLLNTNGTATETSNQMKQAEDLKGLFGQLVPEQNKLAQYAQFLPDLYAAYQMEKVKGPVDMPSQTLARMNTALNYNPIYAQARQQLAQENSMIDRNVSNPVVAAALKRSAANQAQSVMGQTMASEIDQERQLANQYAQNIAQNRNINAQIAAQNQQRQIDFQNEKRAARADMLQQAGLKMGQIYGENQNRQLDLQRLGLSALQFEGDMLGRMGTNLEAMKAAGLI